MVDRLVLWDVDGTLVSCAGVGAEVFDLAIEHVVGRRPPRRIQMSGMTDPQIVTEYLEMLRLDATTAPGGPDAGNFATAGTTAAGNFATAGTTAAGNFATAGTTAAGNFATAGTTAAGNFATAGTTAAGVATDICADLGTIATGTGADDVMSAVLARLQIELTLAADQLQAGRVLPGVRELLARLDDDPGTVQTVLTGNIAPNAATKLGAFDLLRWLDLGIGAFGSDHADRRQLVPVALQRVADRFGAHPPPERVWVVGDAPNDLAAARVGGVNCLLVATGRYPASALADMGPDAVLADLTDTDAVVELLHFAPTARST